MKDYLISIIVPIYGVEPYLKKCVDSIINQTYSNLEIILVDDGSVDGCSKICDEYKEKDSRIRVIHKENGGQNSARVEGMKVATGDYIGYVDADDWIEPDYYEKAINIIKKTNVQVVVFGLIDDIGSKQKKRIPFFKEGLYRGDNFKNNIVPQIFYTGDFFKHGITPYQFDKVFKKEAVESYQYCEGLIENITDDVMVSIPTILESGEVYISHECKYHYVNRNDSTKRTNKKNIGQLIKDNYLVWEKTLKKTGYFHECIEQFRTELIYVLTMQEPEIFDNSNETLSVYGGINSGDKIIIYGAGVNGININRVLRDKNIKIVAWVDSNYRYLEGIENPLVITKKDFDYVIVGAVTFEARTEIRKKLIEEGVDILKIKGIRDEHIQNAGIKLEEILY